MFSVFENKVLRRIFSSKREREEVTGDREKCIMRNSKFVLFTKPTV
jgi:hypothetical protein